MNYLRKSSDGLYYLANNSEKGLGYDIVRLATNNPHEKFVVINDYSRYDLPNVASCSDVLRVSKADNSLKIECKCGKRHNYTKSCSCGKKNPHSKLMKEVFGTNYAKALASYEVEQFLDGVAPKKGIGSFDAHNLEKIEEGDSFIKALASGEEPHFNCNFTPS